MTLRTQTRLMWMLDVGLALVTVAVGAGLALWPVGQSSRAMAVRPATAPSAPGAAPRQKPPLSAYAALSGRDFQQPLFDAPLESRPVPKPTVTLAGTVIQPGNTFALLKTKAGQVQWAAVGQTVEGAEVLEITADSVKIKVAEDTYTLKVEKQGAGP